MKWVDLFGIAPEITGGRSIEEYLHDSRCGCDARRTLAAISDLHQLDTDGHSCTCGVTAPCPTRRVLDREGTT